MARIETDLNRLEQKLAEMVALRRRVLKGVQVEALAECAFRIAVHRTTPTGRAAELLQLAMRTDPANPKYPYHLARLYFQDGDFSRAGGWLNRARKLCPTSHRIWTHIGLLQREVNEINNRRYREQKDYLQDEHKRRWKDISDAISRGSDQFALELATLEPDLAKKPPGAGPQQDKPSNQLTADEPEEIADRITNAGVCRWTRILDLTTEDLLASDAGSRTRDAMRGMMERAARDADSRSGGRALFCVLATEWVMRGYSPEFLRRIRPEPRPDSAADLLLDEVLSLIEAPVESLPAALAASLDGKRVPEVLAAAIHRQFVFGLPMDSGKLIADLRESRVVARTASVEDCTKWLRTLTEDAAVLEPKPFVPVADFPPEADTRAALPEEVLAISSGLLKRTQEDAQSFRKWLDERKAKALDFHSQEEILQANRIRAFVAGLTTITQQALADLKRLRDTGSVQAFADAIQTLENGWQNVTVRPLIVLCKRYPAVDVPVTEDSPATTSASPDPPSVRSSPAARTDKWLTDAEALGLSMMACQSRLQALLETPPQPSEIDTAVRETRDLLETVNRCCADILTEVSALRDSARHGTGLTSEANRLEQTVHDLQPLGGSLHRLLHQLAPPGSPASPPAPPTGETPQPPQDPKARLSGMIEDLEQRLLGRFDAQMQTVSGYSRAQSAEPALQAVRMSVTARKAEALYRLGKRGEARREWAVLLKEDIFDLRLLRNLAIVDTVDGHVQGYLASWQNYVEMLYFQAVAVRDVTYLATERESFHQNYGNAYGLKNLYEKRGGHEPPRPTDPTDLQTFLTSPARIRAYISHQLLAIFNRRLSFRTAPLVLGVTRSAAEPAREDARRKMETWSSVLCGLLPVRTASRFSETVTKSLASACETMKSNKHLRDLAGSKDYHEEQGKYLQWISDVFSWKIRLYKLLEELPKFNGQPGYLDLLAEFAEVDSIPLDTSVELLQPVALQHRQRPDVICLLLEQACANSLVEVLEFVFPKGGVGDPSTEDQRLAIYARLTGELASTRLVSKTCQIIDNPGGVEVFEFYPPQIHEAIRNGNAQSDDIRFLGRLHQQYPLCGGITFHYALVLAHAKNLAEAKRVASSGVSTAFHESSRKDCQLLLDQIRQAGE